VSIIPVTSHIIYLQARAQVKVCKKDIDLLKRGPMKISRGLEHFSYEEFFYNEGGETLQQVAQGSCGCPIIVSVQGQVGQGFQQSDLVKDVPAHGRGV